MRFEPRVKRNPISLTSLIDVIFLLLLYFMLASSFSRYHQLPVSSAAAGAGAGARPALLRLHGEGKMDLNGQPLESAALEAALAPFANDPLKIVAVWTGPGAAVQDSVAVLAAARKAGVNAVLVSGLN